MTLDTMQSLDTAEFLFFWSTQGANCPKEANTRMWADAQRDGRTAEYRWRPLRKFRNSIPCTMPQSLADGHCSSAT